MINKHSRKFKCDSLIFTTLKIHEIKLKRMVQNSEKLTTVVENSNGIKEKFLGHNLNSVDSNCNGVNNKLILDSASNRSSIKSFYQNACILVTGGTGFLGK